MKGTYIGENLRLLYDVLVYTNFYKKPDLLLAVDFEKAFDSVAWSFIKKSLDRFNFGPDIKRWVQTFYTNIKASVAVNSQYTSWFQIERGVRQGDPLSFICNGVEWSKNRTQAAESIKWRPQQAYGSNQVLLSQPQTIFSTPKILTLTHR